MGIIVRKKFRLPSGFWLNLSKRGISFSRRIGRITVNSRGRFSVRLFKGVGYRGGCLVALGLPLVAASASVTVLALFARHAL